MKSKQKKRKAKSIPFRSYKFEPAAFTTYSTAMARRNGDSLFEIWKTASLAVAVCASLGSTNFHARATTTDNNHKHGKIKDRSYFAESPSAVRFKDFKEENDCRILVDSFGSDVTSVQPTSGKAVIAPFSVIPKKVEKCN